MDNIEINVAKEFSRAPAARYRYEGKYSGQQFLEDILEPRFLEAKNKGVKLIIFLDGALGYPSSFVSGSFGKLSIKYTSSEVLAIIKLESSNNTRIEKIIREIQNPTRK